MAAMAEANLHLLRKLKGDCATFCPAPSASGSVFRRAGSSRTTYSSGGRVLRVKQEADEPVALLLERDDAEGSVDERPDETDGTRVAIRRLLPGFSCDKTDANASLNALATKLFSQTQHAVQKRWKASTAASSSLRDMVTSLSHPCLVNYIGCSDFNSNSSDVESFNDDFFLLHEYTNNEVLSNVLTDGVDHAKSRSSMDEIDYMDFVMEDHRHTMTGGEEQDPSAMAKQRKHMLSWVYHGERVALDIAWALEHLHKKNIRHLNLSPASVLLHYVPSPLPPSAITAIIRPYLDWEELEHTEACSLQSKFDDAMVTGDDFFPGQQPAAAVSTPSFSASAITSLSYFTESMASASSSEDLANTDCDSPPWPASPSSSLFGQHMATEDDCYRDKGSDIDPSLLGSVSVKLADFALAAEQLALKIAYARLTSDLSVLSPAYTAPEVLSLCGSSSGTGSLEITEKADVYSLGVIIWELITHEKAWKGTRPMEVYYTVVEAQAPTMLLQQVPRPAYCPTEVWTLIEDCLAYRPSDRPSVSEVISRLLATPSMWHGSKTAGKINPYAYSWSKPNPERNRLTDLGVAALERQSYGLAKEFFSAALRLDSDFPPALLGLRVVLRERSELLEKPINYDCLALYVEMAKRAPLNDAVKNWFLRSSQSPTCIYLMASCYHWGCGIALKPKKAVKLFHLAATRGNTSAMNSLGLCYDNGDCVTQDHKEAVRLYRLAAERGTAVALHNLALCYHIGVGVEKDLKEAVRLHQRAAEQGYAPAQFNLALCYANAEGAERDLAKSAKLYEQAARQGYGPAQFNLALCHENGEGVEVNEVEAVRLYALAADIGHNDSLFNLSLCREKGEGGSRDLKEAVWGYRQCALRGDQDAVHSLKRLGHASPALLSA